MDWALRTAFVTDGGIGWKPMEAEVGNLSAANSRPCVKLSRAFSRLPVQTSPFSCKLLSGKLSAHHQGKAHPVPVPNRWHVPLESFPLLSSCYLLLCSILSGRNGFTQHLPFPNTNKPL